MERRDEHRPLPPMKEPLNCDPAVNEAALKRLWPNRSHESNWLRMQFVLSGFIVGTQYW